MLVVSTDQPLLAPWGNVCWRMFDVFGRPIDRQAPPTGAEWRSVNRPARRCCVEPPSHNLRDRHQGDRPADPIERGGKAGLFAAPGSANRLLTEMIHNVIGRLGGVSIFCGLASAAEKAKNSTRKWTSGRAPSHGDGLRPDERTAGCRFRVGHAALTMAEYFRDDEHRDVLLLIDNIFRFIQAGSELSA